MAVTPFKSSDNFNMAGFNEKITEADNTYVAKTGDTMTGALSMGNNKITDVASPVNDGDVATKGQVDSNTLKFIKGQYIGNGGIKQQNVITYETKPKIVLISGVNFVNRAITGGGSILFADYEYALIYGGENNTVGVGIVKCNLYNPYELGPTLLNMTNIVYNYIMLY